MFKIFSNAFKVKDIRKKIFYIFLIVAIVRLGNAIPIPGINVEMWIAATSGFSEGFSIRSLLGGGVGTIFSMGIGPFITASIVMQLLTYSIPPLEQLQKEGQDGRDKINQYTRVVAVVLAIIQGAASIYQLTNYPVMIPELGGAIGMNLFKYPGVPSYILALLVMLTGTIFVMWLSELLTENGFGNGTSFIIFANILSGFPSQIYSIFSNFTQSESAMAIKIAIILGIIILFIGVIFFAVLIQEGERRIPVQYSKKVVGRQMIGGQKNYIPLKVNIAGVMSIIFALSLIQVPELIHSFTNAAWLAKAVEVLDQSHPIGALVYIILIFFFTFFYTSFAINPVEMAENIRKSGGFIPGIRPGKPTADFITGTIDRLSWIGALCYALIALAPIIFEWITGFKVGFGGTTLLIISSTALEIVTQLESLLLTRHYKGFLK